MSGTNYLNTVHLIVGVWLTVYRSDDISYVFFDTLQMRCVMTNSEPFSTGVPQTYCKAEWYVCSDWFIRARVLGQ